MSLKETFWHFKYIETAEQVHNILKKTMMFLSIKMNTN